MTGVVSQPSGNGRAPRQPGSRAERSRRPALVPPALADGRAIAPSSHVPTRRDAAACVLGVRPSRTRCSSSLVLEAARCRSGREPDVELADPERVVAERGPTERAPRGSGTSRRTSARAPPRSARPSTPRRRPTDAPASPCPVQAAPPPTGAARPSALGAERRTAAPPACSVTQRAPACPRRRRPARRATACLARSRDGTITSPSMPGHASELPRVRSIERWHDPRSRALRS